MIIPYEEKEKGFIAFYGEKPGEKKGDGDAASAPPQMHTGIWNEKKLNKGLQDRLLLFTRDVDPLPIFQRSVPISPVAEIKGLQGFLEKDFHCKVVLRGNSKFLWSRIECNRL